MSQETVKSLQAATRAGAQAEALQGPSHILEIERLSRRFGDREILGSLDLTVASGERVALCGSNGSGKTTLLRCVSGTLTPSAGRVLIDGHETGTLAAQRLIGVSLSQERSFYLRLSGRENLFFFARVRGHGVSEARRRIEALREELELDAVFAQRVDRCSTGMVQQLSFARALIGEPRLLVLDEPTRSLDKEAIERLWAALDRRPATALLIATHNEDDIGRCDHRIELALPAAGGR
jgi:ABC-type multidrug transport system ATPase subunit